MKKENKKENGGLSITITVKAVVLNGRGEVLLLRRSKKNLNGGKWDFPGGWLEGGELFEECLKREIKEETNLDVVIDRVIATVEFPKKEKYPQDKKGLRYLAYHKSGEVKLNKREHDKFEWLPIDEAIKRLSNEGFEGEKRETLIKAKEYLEMKNSLENWKRCLAEFDNYKKRQEEARKDTVKYATENIVMQILPVIDNFASSVAHIPEKEKDGAWVQGIMFIKKQLEDVLRENGVEEIEVKEGDNFDATIHEAIEDKNCASCKTKKKFKNKVKKVVLKGYKIGNKVIRPARVVVE